MCNVVPCTGSVVLTQTHPAALYVCRTGNITLRCQYDGVGVVVGVLWILGIMAPTPNPMYKHPRKYCLPPQELVVKQTTTPICLRRISVPQFSSHLSCWSDPLLPDFRKQINHHFECHLVSWLPQVLLLHCVPLHPRWLHQCHPTCRQWHLPHSDLPPTRNRLQDWGGGCEEGRRRRQTEDKGRSELRYWGSESKLGMVNLEAWHCSKATLVYYINCLLVITNT